MAYWVKFEDGTVGCVEFKFDGSEPHDKRIAKVKTLTEEQIGKKVASVDSLPYPASPRLITVEIEGYGSMPSFCFDPVKCAGRTSCPQRRCCVD